jgi:two-component system CheB/CheR fusion protein
MLHRWFKAEGLQWRVVPELPSTVVFAPHNVLKDAPFTKMDLVVCRNMMIYLMPEAQSRTLALFHFALLAGGVLMLGPSESVSELHEEFDTINSRWKTYRKRRDVRLSADARLPMATPRLALRETRLTAPVQSAAPAANAPLLRAYVALLDDAIPSSILVDERFDVVHVFGDGQRFLQPPRGRMSSIILMMVAEDLRVALAAGLNHASSEQRTVSYDGVRLGGTDSASLGTGSVGDGPNEQADPSLADAAGDKSSGGAMGKLTVKPLPDRQLKTSYYLISLETREAPPPLPESKEEYDVGEISSERIQTLEVELRYTKESLQANTEELQTSNEEMQSTNEELVASNEELQSTNEELHSVNEELHTVNSEYQRKVDELTRLSADMDNLLGSTDVGVIYLDQNLRIRKFTPTVAEFFNLLPQDTGRPIGDISNNISYEANDLSLDVQHVLQGNKLAGAVVVFRDITSRKKAEAERNKYATELERSNKELDEFAYVSSHDLRSPLEGIKNLARWISDTTTPTACPTNPNGIWSKCISGWTGWNSC